MYTMKNEFGDKTLTWDELKALYNACRDYGTLVEGDEWPTWQQVKTAYYTGYARARDDFDNGSISVFSDDCKCFIEFTEL